MNTETRWTLPTADGKTIYGLKNTAGEGAKAAIIIVHGLTGHMNEYAFKRASDYFPEHGYDVYRFNLYDGNDNARHLVDCTLQTHADDLSTVIDHVAPQYEKAFLVGHSYGGPTVMLNPRLQAAAISLWDPSFDLKAVHEAFESNYKPLTGFYCLNWGTTRLIGEAMYNHAHTLDEAACSALAESNPVPLQVVMAGEGYYVNKPLNYDSFGSALNRRDVVKGTVHCFYEGQSCEELLAKTHNWFMSFK